MSKYLFSVVMAVYNVENFLREAIDSVIAQDIGFKQNIQLILVDDGSKDSSGAICDEYSSKYPDNILTLHKENGGVSSARNLGLAHATGEYLNFMDSDDKLSPDVMSCARDFFAKHGEETDVVAFRMMFFDGQTGEHILNEKFNSGDRVIDLSQEWECMQMSVCTCFIRKTSAGDMHFCEALAFAEDAREVNKVLLQKQTLGVMESPIYWYRKRITGEISALQSSKMNWRWYTEAIQNFSIYMMNYAEEKLGFCPMFLQNTIMYDLQWKLKISKIPHGLLSDSEKKEFLLALHNIIKKTDDQVILVQKHMDLSYKAMAFQIKYDAPLKLVTGMDGTLCLTCAGHEIAPISGQKVLIHFIELGVNKLQVEGEISTILPLDIPVQVEAVSNDDVYPCTMLGNAEEVKALENTVAWKRRFLVQIPLNRETEVRFRARWEQGIADCSKITFGKFCPISQQYVFSYSTQNGWLLAHKEGCITVDQTSLWKQISYETKFCKEILRKHEFGFRKAPLTRFLAHILRFAKRKPIWLISDRKDKADDNGETFFAYMRENHPKDVRSYFVIDKNSPDSIRMKQLGPTVHYHGFMHKLLIMAADYVVSSSGDEPTINPFYGRKIYYRDLMVDYKYVFLQHGITKDDISAWINRYAKNIDGFITAAKPEWKSIVDNPRYGYGEDNVWLTGFARFDRLYHNEHKNITIAPTWRKYLFVERGTERHPIKGFSDCAYVRFYHDLLTNQRLLHSAIENNYTISFLPHPNLQPFVSCFDISEDVCVLGKESSYRDVFAESDLFVTDYSSVVFDFAYLRKPSVYCHFDYEEFCSGDHSYSKGYFDYERDGFGEVEYDLEGTVDRIIEYMENGCQLKDKYRQRIDNFFAFNDQNNCERIYQKIMELQNQTL